MIMMDKRVTIVTSLPFWRANRGSLQRVLNQIYALKSTCDLSVLFLGKISFYDDRALGRLKLKDITKSVFDYPMIKKEINPNLLPRSLRVDYSLEIKSHFFGFIEQTSPDLIIIHNIDNYYLTAGEKIDSVAIIDTHDIRSEREESFGKAGVSVEMQITKNDEFSLFNEYDYVIAIHEDDKESLLEWGIEDKKIITCGHALGLVSEPAVCESVSNISYFGSHNKSNVDAIIFFLKEVWFCFDDEGVVLNIYGGVCDHIKDLASQYKNVKVHGMVKDLESAYVKADILINPVRCGSGLKIKNVEAMAYGKPLLTTKEGARGLSTGVNKAFLVADTDIETIKGIINFLYSKDIRDAISANALAYAKERFTFTSAFKELRNVVGSLK